MSEIPPPPPGFILEPQPQASNIPPPPPGFVLDGQAAAPDNRSFLGRVGDQVTAGAKGLYNLRLTDVLKGMAESAKSAVTLPGDVYSGRVDPMSETGRDRAWDLAGFGSPLSAGSRAKQVITAPVAPIARDAAELGVNLTAGQRTGKPSLMSQEDAMLGGGMGQKAQDIAQAARAQQDAQIKAARDAIGETVGEGKVRLDRPADAGGIVGSRVNDVGTRAAESIAARNAAEAARIVADEQALFAAARTAGESLGGRFNPAGFTPVEAGARVGAQARGAAAQGKAGYQQAYGEAFSREGQVDPGFFTGVNKPGSNSLTAPGAPINDFAAPISSRIKERMLQLDEPIIPDATITPLASRTLSELDRIAELNLGRIGNPQPGQTVSGVNLRGVEQARKIIIARARAAKATPEDARAMRGIISAFDDQVERVFDSALFSGDRTALQGIKEARAAFRKYQETFKAANPGDDAGKAIEKIVERNATPEEVSNYVLGASRIGDTGLSVRVFDRLKSMLGPNSPHLAEIRGAAWQKLAGDIDVTSPSATLRSAAAIREFTDGRGSTLAKKMFSPDEVASMRRYANGLASLSNLAKQEATKVEATGAIKTLIDVANKRLSPEDMAGAMFGYGDRITTANLRLVDAVGDIVGKNGPEWAAIRQGMWQKLTGRADGNLEMGPQRMSQKLDKFLNGDGKTMAEKLYGQNELAQMRKLASIQSARVKAPGTTNPANSGNRLAGMVRDMMANIGGMIGMGAGGPVGAAAGYGAGKAAGAVGDAMNASRARQLFRGDEPVAVGQRAGDAAMMAGRRLGAPVTLETIRQIDRRMGDQR